MNGRRSSVASSAVPSALLSDIRTLIEAARQYHEKLSGETRERFRIVHLERGESDIPGKPTRTQAARGAAGGDGGVLY